MSQDVSNNQRESEALANSSSIKPWSVEAYADHLMDDLFADIDRVLEGGSVSPPEQPSTEYVSLQPVKVPQATLPPTWVPPHDLLPPRQQDNTPRSIVQMPVAIDVRVEDVEAEESEKSGKSQSFDKLLFGFALASVLVTVLLWAASQDRLKWLFSREIPAAQVTQEAQPKVDEQFVNYMERSLESIERKAEANKQNATRANVPPTSNLPSVSGAPGNGSGGANRSSVMERVYIPIYPSPSSQLGTSGTGLGLQSIAPLARPQLAPALPMRPIRPVPQILPVPSVRPALPARPKPQARLVPPVSLTSPMRLTPPPMRLAAPAKSAPPMRPAPAPKPPVAATIPQPQLPPPPPPSALPELSAATAPAPVAEAIHTLVGVLELGNRSAALFSINGVTKRLQVGENIGSSGWTLVSVDNQEAIIRRNGEVRSIYVGQKF
ncbi:hypothetical protein NDI37_19795 [Funiculus sociatus GB2-A5]|uniref:Type II secretion system protein GspC N-terminal domain-containing protein n=1 Tax=Funiculus sociatus GB2-A5 TaxID=2933946 RepID=A0ABV0JTB7_9CYAN|nr:MULTISPECIES: hypothetical protein [unclassified Trichocoleus]MBD1905476.1 hypothetical protein [Trichocoleus sp. FACHB-832]MBD2062333.1 hypothetical protein [Trichocoleus sp. FACHB-6]